MRLSHVSAETLSFVHRFGQQTFRSDPRELIDVYQVRLLRNRRPNVTSWGYRTFAEPFTSAISAHLTQIDIGLTTFVGTSGYAGYSEEIIVSLALNDGGMLGKTLASWDLTNLDLPVFGTASNSVTTISNILGVHLKAGESYYLLLSPANSMTADVWNTNALNTTNTRLWNGEPQPDALSGAFRIWGTPTPPIDPVPLPSAFSLFGTGLGLLGLLGWRRKRKAQAV